MAACADERPRSSAMILAADIGGTNTRLAVFQRDGKRLTLVAEGTLPSREHTGLESALQKFVALHPLRIHQACFSVAGPVRNGRCETTDQPWVVDARQVAREPSLKTVGLINDLEANAYGIAALGPKDFITLNAGSQDPEVNQAIISAGTGLGEAGLSWDGRTHRPFATEGGHATFAPQNELEGELLRYLRGTYDHVSVERVLSGPGLVNIYTFLRDTGRGEESTRLADRMRQEDPAAVIAVTAFEGNDGLCVRALDLLFAIYGAEAGNLALKMIATGGVFIGGGIAPKIFRALKNTAFMEAFTAKGRMKPLLQAMPVRVILNSKTALLGAARWVALRGTATLAGARPAEDGR
jgi:glucokinase